MHDFRDKIEKNYGFSIKVIKQYRDGFVADTSYGKKLIKKTNLSTGKINFIHCAKEHVFKNGFERIDRYNCGFDQLPYVIIDEEIYIVADFFEGRECDFDNREDIVNASVLLANMHKASKGFTPPKGSYTQDNLGKIPFYFGKRLEEIKKLKKFAEKERKKFDYMFLEHFDYFCNLGEESISLINASRYNELVQLAKNEGSFCHHDFTYQNIIVSHGRLSLINFDYCTFELKIYDIANFLRRKMRKSNWDIKQAKLILDNYRKVEEISDDEFFVLKIMLMFPQKFWRVLNRYYNSNRSWAQKSYLNRLQEVVDETKYHSAFLEKFDSII